MRKRITKKFVDKWADHFVIMKSKSVLSRNNIKVWIRRMLKDFRNEKT